LYYYDTNTWERVGVIPVGLTPSGIIYDKKRDLIIISNRDENLLTIIQDNKIVQTVEVGDHPFGIFLSDDSIFSVNVYSNDVSKIDLNTFDSFKFDVGDHPYNIISSDEYLFVTNTQDDSVSVINKVDFSIQKTLKTGEVPENLGIDSLNNQLIVTNWGSNSISVFDLDSLENIKNIPTGRESRSFGNFIWTK
jgi:YVTN family beta-propeller protein